MMTRGPMATTKVSLEEYLNTSYRPDVEYIDGELQQRNVGEIEHAKMILAVLLWFCRTTPGMANSNIAGRARAGEAGALSYSGCVCLRGFEYRRTHRYHCSSGCR